MRASAEDFVAAFCSYFGDEAAGRIAGHVLDRLPAAAGGSSLDGRGPVCKTKRLWHTSFTTRSTWKCRRSA